MRVAGIMSGTSLDGIDVAIVDVSGTGPSFKYSVLAFEMFPYPHPVRARLLRLYKASDPLFEISQMNFLLGELYADAVIETCRRNRIGLGSIELCGMHGQTIFHKGSAVKYCGWKIASTLQIGEPAVVAARTGIQTISNFRERDIAAGGQGAPLVPYVDHLLFHSRRIDRIALNIGGIANITVLPAGAKREEIVAFDTGPGNMVMDALVKRAPGSGPQFDRGGKIAKSGKVNRKILDAALQTPYFSRKPPKSCGREEFGGRYVRSFLRPGVALRDSIATATELTAVTIAHAIKAWAPETTEVIASGGGVHNQHLMRRLKKHLAGLQIHTTAEYGIDPDAKEAIAFAVLAYESLAGRPGNLPSATGASRPVVLGKLTPGR
jgi:anhydro-N-acetylmuramic acid kinase